MTTAPRFLPLALRFLAVALFLALALGADAAPSADDVASGDANCDGAVNAVDSLAVLRSVAGLPLAACIAAADVNCDGATSALDALSILRHVAGLAVSLPPGCPPICSEQAAILLNEIAPRAGPGGHQFVELINAVSAPADANGLSLLAQGAAAYALPAGMPALAPGDLLLIIFDGGNSIEGLTVHSHLSSYLTAGSGALDLVRSGEALDRIAWGNEQAGAVPSGGGGLNAEAEAGSTLGRFPGASAPSDRSQWLTFPPFQASPGGPNRAPSVQVGLPLDGAVFAAGDLPLTWYPVPGADGYRVQVDTEPGFSSPVVDQVTASLEVSTASLPAGDYFWRVAVSFGDVDSPFSPAQSFTIGPASFNAAGGFANLLDVPYLQQRKDTRMLLLERDAETGAHAWDVAHPALDKQDPADRMNCALAALAMINRFHGGNLSQDRIGYEIFRGRRPGPEWDLNYDDGVNYAHPLDDAFEFALGVPPTIFPGGGADQKWAFITGAIDQGYLVLAAIPGHAIVLTGYSLVGNQKYVNVHDPWSAPYSAKFNNPNFVLLWRPSSDPVPAEDEPEIARDSDADGVIDFDEVRRFQTHPLDPDTDRDGLPDKQDIRRSVFGQFGYINLGRRGQRDWDGDDAPNERDCDSDNDGTKDGDDDYDFDPPPSGNQPKPCEAGSSVVTLSWNADADLDVWVLPQPAANFEEAIGQYELPGYKDNQDADCLLPAGQTARAAVIDEVSSGANYVGVFIFHGCAREPPGPAGDGPGTVSFALTVQFADGSVRQFTGTVTQEADDWRLFGPFDF